MSTAQVRLETDLNPGGIPNSLNYSPKLKSTSIDLLNENPLNPLKIKKEDKGIDFLGEEKYRDSKELFDHSKLEENPNIPLDAFRRNQQFGDFTTDGDYIQVACRDYGYVDGDIIDVYVNDKQVASDVYLRGNYRVLPVKLDSGFNKIVLEAKNMGSAPPNTAELIILNEDGSVISTNRWALATGYNASFVVAKN